MQIDPNEVIDTSDVGWGDVIAAVVVVVVAIILSRVVAALVRRALRRFPELQPGLARFTARIVGWTIVLLGLVVALTLVGVNTGPLILLLAILAVIVVVSGRPLLESFGAGVVLQTQTPFRVGDQVKLEGHTGTVVDVNGRATVIDTPDGERVHIPNTSVLGEPIVNLTTRGARRTTLEVGVEYGTDLPTAIDVIGGVLASTPEVFDDPKPEVLLSTFGDSSIVLLARFWHEPRVIEGLGAADAVALGIDDAFREHDLVIAFPQRVVWHRHEDGDELQQ